MFFLSLSILELDFSISHARLALSHRINSRSSITSTPQHSSLFNTHIKTIMTYPTLRRSILAAWFIVAFA